MLRVYFVCKILLLGIFFSEVISSEVETETEAEELSSPTTTVNKTEVYEIVEKYLLGKLSTPNDTLFEKQTKQLFARFLIELAVDRKDAENSTEDKPYRVFRDDPQNYYQQQEQYLPIAEQAVQGSQLGTQQEQQNSLLLQQQNQPQEQYVPPQQEVPQQGQYVPQEQVAPQQQQQVPQTQQGEYVPQQQTQGQFVPQQQTPGQFVPQQQTPGQFVPQQQTPGQFVPQQQQGQYLPATQPGVQGQQNGQYPGAAVPYPYPGPTRAPETLSEVDKLLQQIFRLNVTGILDQSLYLVGSGPIRNLGSGVLKLVFCDPISRLLGRCRGNDTLNKKLNIDNLKL